MTIAVAGRSHVVWLPIQGGRASTPAAARPRLDEGLRDHVEPAIGDRRDVV